MPTEAESVRKQRVRELIEAVKNCTGIEEFSYVILRIFKDIED